MKRVIVALLMLLTILPATVAWAEVVVSPHVYVGEFAVSNKAVSKADAAIMTDALRAGLKQAGFAVVSKPDSSYVGVWGTVGIRSGWWRQRYNVRLNIEAPVVSVSNRRIVDIPYDRYGDFIGGFKKSVPQIVKEKIKPAIEEMIK